jgi:hypothetical protein
MTRQVNRFDHAVIAVEELEAAIEDYRALGFAVARGGRHTGRGTHNAIIRFGLDYLELIAIEDSQLARAAGGNVADLVGYLERTGGGLLGFALAATDLDDIAANWTSGLAAAGSPVEMERIRPDGGRLAWRLLIPGGSAWRKPWPFLIEWHTPERERLAGDTAGGHANGVSRVEGVSVATSSVQKLMKLYAGDLGLNEGRAGGGARRFELGSFNIEVFEPAAGSPAAESMAREGEGLFEIRLAATDAQATGAARDSARYVLIPATRTRGARLERVTLS